MKLRLSLIALSALCGITFAVAPHAAAQGYPTSPQDLLTRDKPTDRFMIGDWQWHTEMFGQPWKVTGLCKPNGQLEIHADREPYGAPKTAATAGSCWCMT